MNQPTPFASEAPPSPDQPFKKWADCQKALKALRPPLDLQTRERFIARIAGSSQRHHMAFELLCLLQDVKQGPRLRWIEGPMLALLSGGAEPPAMIYLTAPADARKWVCHELHGVHTLADWKQFVATGRHYWVLYSILRTGPNTQVLIEALSEFTECAVRCQNTDDSGRPKKRSIQASDPAWIIKLIKAKIPAKPELPKAFLEQLYALTATAALSEAFRAENDHLQAKLEGKEKDLANEAQARATAERNTKELQEKFDATAKTLEETQTELAEERLHTKRQGGFNAVAKKETVNHVLSVVRRGTSYRLDNIRGYADREKPNREEILALVGEIESHLARLEVEVAQ